MARRGILYYVVKANRISGWFLLFLVSLFIVTGFALCGMFGFKAIIDSQRALVIHKFFDWPLIVFFLVHATASTYLAFRRWGWVGKKKGKSRSRSPSPERP